MKRCIFAVVTIVALLFMTAGSLSAFDVSNYKADKPESKHDSGTRECLSLFNKKAEWKAEGAILFPYQTDKTVCSCIKYCEASDLDKETCNILKNSCAEKSLKQIVKMRKASQDKDALFPFGRSGNDVVFGASAEDEIKETSGEDKISTDKNTDAIYIIHEIIRPTLPNNTKEAMCAYLFSSALEKDISFTENVPCGCSLYCSASKVMCANFDFFCAYSVLRGENDDAFPVGEKQLQLRRDSKKLDSITVNQGLINVPSNEIQTQNSLHSCMNTFIKYSNGEDYDHDSLCSCASEYPETFSSPSILTQCEKEELIQKIERR